MTQLSLATLLIVAGVLVALVVLAVVFVVMRDRARTVRRVEAAFRGPVRPPKTAGNEQYYRPYWTR